MTSKAEELWENYAIDEMVDRAPFLAALREYGAEVRKRDAEIVKLSRGVFTLSPNTPATPAAVSELILREPLP